MICLRSTLKAYALKTQVDTKEDGFMKEGGIVKKMRQLTFTADMVQTVELCHIYLEISADVTGLLFDVEIKMYRIQL